MNSTNLSYVDLLSIFALFLCLFYAFQNFTLKNKSKANRIFTVYFLNLSFIILFFFLIENEFGFIAKYLIPILIFSVLMLSPILWLYQKQLVSERLNKSIRRHLLLPVIVSSVFALVFISTLLTKDKQLATTLVYIMQLMVYVILIVVFLGQNIFYITLFFLKFAKHRRNIANFYSYTEKIDLTWLMILIIGYIFLFIGLIISNFIKGEASDVTFYLVLITYIVYTGHNALKQKELVLEHKTVRSGSDLSPDGLSDPAGDLEEHYTEAQHQMFQELKLKLEKYISEEKPYLDQELTIFKLAKDLNSNTKYLSYIINKEFKQNFINFINERRIIEVKKNLLDQKKSNFTIEALAQNAGFKSKSSFNAAFKKSTGTTPSDFMKFHLN